MPEPSTADRLSDLSALTAIPRAQLEWLVAHGELRRFADGDTVYSKDRPDGVIRSPDDPRPGLLVVMEGRLSVRRKNQAGVDREIRELKPGSVSGVLPYSRLKAGAGFVVADGPAEILLIAAADIQEMTRACYDFTALCVHEMLDRVRVFTSDDRHLEKMASLGRLSAGIAHELNNPSSAIGRSAREMDACRREVAAAAEALGAAALSGEALAAFKALEAAAERAPQGLPALAQADREEAIEAWLAEHDVDGDLAELLANTGVAIADFDAANAALAPDELSVALRYVAVNATAGRLTAEIENAARRIHSLVAAVKKHTHMDQEPSAEAIRLDAHLTDTLTLVESRARAKGVALELTVEPDLPAVEGVVGELNQVWLNLLDNAIDAAAENGHVSVTAACERDVVMVRVIDDGAGIAEADLARVFEPFFTTKSVGEGAGLGLDVVRTTVRNHRGTVDASSRPGRTEFRVCLPAAG